MLQPINSISLPVYHINAVGSIPCYMSHHPGSVDPATFQSLLLYPSILFLVFSTPFPPSTSDMYTFLCSFSPYFQVISAHSDQFYQSYSSYYHISSFTFSLPTAFVQSNRNLCFKIHLHHFTFNNIIVHVLHTSLKSFFC